MINETLVKIKSRVEETKFLSAERREALLTDVTKLTEELHNLERTEEQQAKALALLTQQLAHSTLQEEPDKCELELRQDNLKNMLQQFEASHPKLTHTLNSILMSLAGMGI